VDTLLNAQEEADVQEILQEFIQGDVMEDRKEYDVEEFTRSLPFLSSAQVQRLYTLVQEFQL